MVKFYINQGCSQLNKNSTKKLSVLFQTSSYFISYILNVLRIHLIFWRSSNKIFSLKMNSFFLKKGILTLGWSMKTSLELAPKMFIILSPLKKMSQICSMSTSVSSIFSDENCFISTLAVIINDYKAVWGILEILFQSWVIFNIVSSHGTMG